MRRHEKTLLAGTLLVTATLAPFCGVATSQSLAINGQVQLGDVFATQTLDVVEVSDSTTATTAATGNSYLAAVESGSLNVQSSQTLSGSAVADTTVNVATNSGAVTVLTTAATGNTGEAASYGYSDLDAVIDQSVGAVSITADSRYEGPLARTGDLTASVQAVANAQSVYMTGGSSDATITQSSAALTQADGGGVLQYTQGQATFLATAASNSVTGSGTAGADQTLRVTQSMTGERTQASKFVAVGNGYLVTGQATASANTISLTNENNPLVVVADQTNAGYVQAQAEVSSFQFGAGTANAYGVGNSVLAGNYGPSVEIDNTQVNSGDGVSASAGFTGDSGYDAYASATAVGNAVTAYACSTCTGVFRATNSQTNSTGVGATAATTVTGANRSVNGVATATGNSASFYVSSPGS